ncbi:hypothetical protein MCETE4_00028 [Acidimicrobiia bacterium]
MAEPLELDCDDFDAVGILTDAIVSLRAHVLINETDGSASVSAPEGWHRLVINAKVGGSSVLVVRFNDLSASRLRNVATALDGRGWQLDEDREGATLRQPPGTNATDSAFEILSALGLGGAPTGVRRVEARDAQGNEIDLSV